MLLVSIDYAHEKLAGLTALLCRIVGGNSELWCDVNCRVVVCEPHNSHVVRYLQSTILYGVEDGEGHRVVESQNGVGWIWQRKQLLGSLYGVFLTYLTAFYYLSVNGNAVFTESLKVSVLAAAYHIEVVWPSNKGNPPTPVSMRCWVAF